MPVKRLSQDEAINLLIEERIGHLATCSSDGVPYITPLNYVYYQGNLYFHCSKHGRKLDIIAMNHQVCFAVNRVDKSVFAAKACDCATRYRSVLVFGNAALVDDPQRKADILNALTEKHADGRAFQPADADTASHCAVVEIQVESIEGKCNVDAR